MIPGSTIERVAVRVLYADTFDLVMSPAIADLQFEAATASAPRLAAGYAAVWRALAVAFLSDARRAWQLNAETIVPLMLMQSAYYLCLLAFAGGLFGMIDVGVLASLVFRPTIGSVLVLLSVTVVLPGVTTAACFLSSRIRRTG